MYMYMYVYIYIYIYIVYAAVSCARGGATKSVGAASAAQA